jgi:hypothetical protein
MAKAYSVRTIRSSARWNELLMSNPGLIRRDLMIHALASTIASYLMLSRAVDIADMTSANYWWAMIIALIAGGIQTAGLIGRCKTIDWWNRRRHSAQERYRLFLHRHAGLVTGVVLAVAIGYVLVYDGYWMLYEDYVQPYPDNPFWLNVLWSAGYMIGLAAVLGYVRLILRQIGTTYGLSRREQVMTFIVGMVPEVVGYSILACILLALGALIFGGSR